MSLLFAGLRTLVIGCLVLSGATYGRARAACNYSDFTNRMMKHESDGVLDAVNKYGYLGLFQMGEDALVAAKFRKGGEWTPYAKAMGVHSKADFLNNEKAQIAAIELYWEDLAKQARSKKIMEVADPVHDLTPSGIIAGCHLLGCGRMRQFAKSDGSVIPMDGKPGDPKRTPITKYINEMASCETPFNSIVDPRAAKSDHRLNAAWRPRFRVCKKGERAVGRFCVANDFKSDTEVRARVLELKRIDLERRRAREARERARKLEARPVPRGATPTPKSDITGLGRRPTDLTPSVKPSPPVDVARGGKRPGAAETPTPAPKKVGGVKVDVDSEGRPEDLSVERDEILKMRKR